MPAGSVPRPHHATVGLGWGVGAQPQPGHQPLSSGGSKERGPAGASPELANLVLEVVFAQCWA